MLLRALIFIRFLFFCCCLFVECICGASVVAATDRNDLTSNFKAVRVMLLSTHTFVCLTSSSKIWEPNNVANKRKRT